MLRLLYTVVLGLVGALFVHVAIVLLLPLLSANDVWRQIQAKAEPYQVFRLDGAGETLAAARQLDPMSSVVACRYDLIDGVLRVTAPNGADFWSIAVFDDRGHILFSANDRIVASDNLDLAVALPAQMRAMQQNLPGDMTNAILTESGRSEGFVIVRVIRPDESWKPVAEAFLGRVQCGSRPL
jgi:uncharacterized membrane protein